jgi:hypothetical protein
VAGVVRIIAVHLSRGLSADGAADLGLLLRVTYSVDDLLPLRNFLVELVVSSLLRSQA